MNDESKKCYGHVVGPDGSILTPMSLPQGGPIRWVARRKAELVAAVGGGLLTLDEACRRYGISPEEFLEWQRRYAARGLTGLKASVRQVNLPL